jgi:ADP-ribosyl-[dinitrogen reductase] hydrolase
MVRTSETDPLKIDELMCDSGGVIGMTFCPGKCGASGYGDVWSRDLECDLGAIRAWRPDAVVTLMEAHEFEPLGVAKLPEAFAEEFEGWFHLPIRDVDIPDQRFERLWVYAGHMLRGILQRGGRVLVHCRGGLGRTGLVAARLLVELGLNADQAIAKVRRARPRTIETRAQEAYVRACQPVLHDERVADRILGCLFGGAVGDAFGYTVEFDRWPDIRARYGESGLQEPVLVDGKLVVSDDTQMTLFTAAGFLAAIDGGQILDPDAVLSEIRCAYLDWYRTQTEAKPPAAEGLNAYRCLWARRAPGVTCLSALATGADGTPAQPINDSKGCGGVMRVAPLGLSPALNADHAFALADKAAAFTHGHPSGRLSAAALASLIRDLVGQFDVADAITRMRARLSSVRDSGEVLHATDQAVALAGEALPASTAIRRMGEGWVGEEALAIAIYAMLRADDFISMLRIAANHDGDSDSTASVACQIWGAANGARDIPISWVQRLDVLEPLCAIAGKLIEASEAELGPDLVPRLQALADLADDLEATGSNAVAWMKPEVGDAHLVLGWPDLSDVARQFVRCVCDMGWVRPFNWLAWAYSAEGRHFAHDRSAITYADHVQLRRFLTTVIRNDHYCEGVLAEAFQAGQMTAVAKRAAEILAQLQTPQTANPGSVA